MARTSRNFDNTLKSNKNDANKKIWNVALYIRLSKEDGNDVSCSVVNQKAILQDYVERYGDDFSTVDLYIDDGFSGATSDREAFQRLLDDIHNKKINCVIVKDLSRFARNYVDAGHLLENEFLVHNVRFICLSPQLDSYLYPDTMNSVLVPILNVMNDDFCRQTSNKVKAVLDMKMRNGDYLGAFAPYGYLKVLEDKTKIVVDEEAAEIVRNIYDWFVNEGMSKNGIARKLNELGVLTPSAYKCSTNKKYKKKHKNELNAWVAKTVTTILTNRIYVGDMAQGKTKKISYKIKKLRETDKSEWIIVENTHEAIVSREIFEKAQELQQRDTRTAPQTNVLYLLSGFLRCNDCNRTIKRKKGRANSTKAYYDCSTYLTATINKCTKRTIREDRLFQAVLTAIKHQINLAVCYDKLLEEINSKPIISKQSKNYENDIKKKNAELKEITALKEGLYKDWKSGDITREDYKNMRESFEEQAERLKIIIGNLEKEQRRLKENADKNNPFLTTFLKYKDINELDRDVVVSLVNMIYIAEDGNIHIEFKYSDEYKRLVEFIEDNQHMSA